MIGDGFFHEQRSVRNSRTFPVREQFCGSSGDRDQTFKTYADMTAGILQKHAEAKQAVELVEFCQTLDVARYKKVIPTLEGELGPTLFDHGFGLEAFRKAAA